MTKSPHEPRVSPTDDLDLKPLIQTAEAAVDEVRPHPIPSSWWKRIKPFIPIIAMFLVGIGIFFSPIREQFSLSGLHHNYDLFQQLVVQHPVLSVFVFALVLSTAIATGLPGAAAIEIIGGVLFGTLTGAGLNLFGAVCGASVLFYLGRRAVAAGNSREPPAMVERIRKHFAANPISYAFFMRLVPFFPFGGVSLALAWLRCSVPLFFSATFFGVLPTAFVYSWLGAGLQQSLAQNQAISPNLFTQPQLLYPLVGLAMLGILPMIWRVLSDLRDRVIRNKNKLT